MEIFWICRQISQIGLLVAPSYSRHVLCGTLLSVCWGINLVFTIKIGREMAIFQARMKKWNWCLCQFRLFFFSIDLHRGQPLAKFGPNNSIWQEIRGLFLPANWKSSLFIDIVQLYLHQFFLFLGIPSMKVSSFLDRRSAYVQGYNKEHVAIEKWRFFYFFLSFIMKCFVLYTFETFKLIKVLKKVGFGLQNAHLKM